MRRRRPRPKRPRRAARAKALAALLRPLRAEYRRLTMASSLPSAVVAAIERERRAGAPGRPRGRSFFAAALCTLAVAFLGGYFHDPVARLLGAAPEPGHARSSLAPAPRLLAATRPEATKLQALTTTAMWLPDPPEAVVLEWLEMADDPDPCVRAAARALLAASGRPAGGGP